VIISFVALNLPDNPLLRNYNFPWRGFYFLEKKSPGEPFPLPGFAEADHE
jgi:hypothetical protein